MKSFGLICKAALFILLVAVALFLFLTYKTMYKQNHVIPILEYHNLTTEPSSVTPWTISVNDFNDQMFYLSRNCHVVPLKTVLESIRQGKSIPEHTVAVTFDDGYKSNYLLAYPILEKYRIPATIFIIGKYIDNDKVGGYPALTWSDLKTMVSSGLVDIESHTYDLHHKIPDNKGNWEPAVLARIATDKGTETQEEYDQRIESDLVQSRQVIKEKLGIDPDILCWPNGAYDNHTNTLAKKAGFVYMIGQLTYSNPQTNIENIGRVIVSGRMGIKEYEKLVYLRKATYFQAMGLELERIKYHLINVFKRG